MRRVGQRDLPHLASRGAELLDRRPHRLFDLRIEPFAEVLAGHADAQAPHAFGNRRRVVGHRPPRRRLIVHILAGDLAQQEGGAAHVLRERPDLVERAGERDHAIPRDAAVGGLDADAADERGRLADRSAGVGAERTRHHPSRHRRSTAA